MIDDMTDLVHTTKDSLEVENKLKTFLDVSHEILKKEWERVKTGELFFNSLKIFLFIFIVLSLSYTAYDTY